MAQISQQPFNTGARGKEDQKLERHMEVDTDLMHQKMVAEVLGRVQGVGFRYFVRTAAKRLGVTGWVCNSRDGSVRVVAEGSASHLNQLLEALRHGPSLASVDDVRCEFEKPSGRYADFDIRS